MEPIAAGKIGLAVIAGVAPVRLQVDPDQLHDCAEIIDGSTQALQNQPHGSARVLWIEATSSTERWAHTSAVMALLANVHRDRRKKATPYKPADFNPAGEQISNCRAGRRRYVESFVKVNIVIVNSRFWRVTIW